ncbi:nonstructural protein [Peromfec virus RodF8_33]|uniref:Nonstructural protein n=1 Tax=Peromfec virus RodF8_33 TaxID=2929370 RepID=A0A976R5H8_9VIRU|nr:nonstructural protein [Peromfec virus RodF8_33]
MIYPLYSVQDAATGFLTPTMDSNDASALRNFRHAMIASRDVMHTHPSDFALYRIGSFDTESGILTPLTPPALILRGSKEEIDHV